MEAAAKFILQRIFKYLGYANNLLNNVEVHKRYVKRNTETPRDMLECAKLPVSVSKQQLSLLPSKKSSEKEENLKYSKCNSNIDAEIQQEPSDTAKCTKPSQRCNELKCHQKKKKKNTKGKKKFGHRKKILALQF